MVFVGDYFALGLVIVLGMFYFDGKTASRYMSDASKCFIACLVLTALTAVTDLITGQLLTIPHVPLWANMAVNTLYFLVNIITTSAFALFLFTKILHDHGPPGFDHPFFPVPCSGGGQSLDRVAVLF